MKFSLLIILSLNFSCFHEKLSPKFELIEPYSSERELKEPFPDKSFGQIFEKENFKLTYIAGYHANQRNSKTFTLVEKALNESGAKLVILEGFEYKHGESPKSFLRSFQETSTKDFYRDGETAFAALEATKRNISFVGGEPEEKDLLEKLQKEGVGKKDLLFFYFLRQIPQFKRQKELDKNPLEKLFKIFVKNKVRNLEIKQDSNPDFKEFKAWYKTKNKKAFSLKSFDPEEVAPRITGKLYSQRLSGKISLERDKFIVKVIAESLEKYKNVMIIYGKSHLSSQRPAIEELLGKAHTTSY